MQPLFVFSLRTQRILQDLLKTAAMATSGEESFDQSAYEAFRKHSAELLTAIQDPEVLAWQLFAKNIITPDVRDDAVNMMHSRVARTSKLLVAVETQITVNPAAFAAFLSVLDDKRPGMNDLCKRMRDAYPFGKPSRITCASSGEVQIGSPK